MCNVREPIEGVDEVVGYKVVKEINGSYYSLFAGFRVEVGPVEFRREQLRPVFSGCTGRRGRT